MDPLEILGIASALVVLFAFVGNEYGKFNADSFTYDLLNFVGAVGLFFYAYSTGVMPFMITNGVWAVVSGVDVWRYLSKKKTRKKR